MSDDYETHDITVAVIVRAEGVDHRDAADRAEIAVRRALHAQTEPHTTTLRALIERDRAGVDTGLRHILLAVLEVGQAARNAYLSITTTPQAAHQRGLASD